MKRVKKAIDAASASVFQGNRPIWGLNFRRGRLFWLAVGRGASLSVSAMAIPATALVADDEDHIRSYVRIILNHLGVEEVFEAKTGDEALQVFREKSPDVVLLDINMPGLTGLEALPKIIEMDPDAVVIMLTGHASRHLIEDSSRAGAVHYIRKDTPQQEITRMLRELFDEIFMEE